MSLTCRTITHSGEVDGLTEDWNRLHDRARGTVFQTHDWLSEWWHVYGGQFALRILTGWVDGTLVGVFPAFIQTMSFTLFPLRRMRFMGEHIVVGEYMPLVDPSFASEFAAAAAEYCAGQLASGECDALDFNHFPIGSAFMIAFVAEVRARGFAVRHTPQSTARIVMNLPGGWQEYLHGLRGSERRQLLRSEAALEREGVTFQCVDCAQDPAAFDSLVELHTKVWRAKGQEGHFRSWEGFEEFQRRVTGRLGRKGNAFMYFLTKNGERLAAIEAFRMHDQLCLYLGGRDPNHVLARHGLGKAIVGRAVKDALARGLTVCDLQQGMSDYKMRLGGARSWYSRAVAYPAGLRGTKGRVLIAAFALRRWVEQTPLKRLVPRIKRLLRVG
jgi:CelD/BcsL family acetyltransferase involved in cellulose biosynthesis